MATACNWAIRLVPLLTGKAHGAYVAMDWKDAEEAILIKYEIYIYTYI